MATDTPSEAIVDLYDRRAAQWAEDRGRGLRLERAWLERFTAALATGAAVLDIGCGSGEPVANYLIDKGLTITGIDSSPKLVEIARRTLPRGRFDVADMRTLSLGRRFDGLIAWHSFFHLTPDVQRGMFARFAAHATGPAMLMFTSGPEEGEIVGEWRGEPLYSASLSPTEYRRLLDANGFEVIDYVPDDPETGGATVWLARARS